MFNRKQNVKKIYTTLWEIVLKIWICLVCYSVDIIEILACFKALQEYPEIALQREFKREMGYFER